MWSKLDARAGWKQSGQAGQTSSWLARPLEAKAFLALAWWGYTTITLLFMCIDPFHLFIYLYVYLLLVHVSCIYVLVYDLFMDAWYDVICYIIVLWCYDEIYIILYNYIYIYICIFLMELYHLSVNLQQTALSPSWLATSWKQEGLSSHV